MNKVVWWDRGMPEAGGAEFALLEKEWMHNSLTQFYIGSEIQEVLLYSTRKIPIRISTFCEWLSSLVFFWVLLARYELLNESCRPG
jgi:hypothetical protein